MITAAISSTVATGRRMKTWAMFMRARSRSSRRRGRRRCSRHAFLDLHGHARRQLQLTIGHHALAGADAVFDDDLARQVNADAHRTQLDGAIGVLVEHVRALLA